MECNLKRHNLEGKPNYLALYDDIQNCVEYLENAVVFYEFPIYKDYDDETVFINTLIIDKKYGIILFIISDTDHSINKLVKKLEHNLSLVHSRLLRNPILRAGKLQLIVPIHLCIYSPNRVIRIEDSEITLIKNTTDLSNLLKIIELDTEIEDVKYKELISTLDGSKGLIRRKPRKELSEDYKKGYYAKVLENEISIFDKQQRYGSVLPTMGPHRIRGIAGTGKTVVLAMKTALTHLKYPEASIVYTFYTKSLYQLVKRMITRFYRQFDDKDPDWEKIIIMHAWGGKSYPGVYYMAAKYNNYHPLSLINAKVEAIKRKISPFDLVCQKLKDEIKLSPIYDFIFIDEGQDFPASFIDLCRQITKDDRVVWAYDELQNIFDINTPKQEEVFGVNEEGKPIAEILEDTVLYKSYRNPREILTTAHALGFGIYSDKIVQMFENKEHWEDLGYKVEGSCKAGEKTTVSRPIENSTKTISDNYKFDEIIIAKYFNSIDEEVDFIFNSVKKDIAEGLRPDDILVTIVDDINSTAYRERLIPLFNKAKIPVNDTQKDKYGIVDFYMEGAITLTTIHKAKGNESFQVYIVGIDAIFFNPDIINRNRIFTAMTRAKAWVTITGLGDAAKLFCDEIKAVSKSFPNISFKYPSKKDIKIMRRDMSKKARERLVAERSIDEALKSLSKDEIMNYLKVINKK